VTGIAPDAWWDLVKGNLDNTVHISEGRGRLKVQEWRMRASNSRDRTRDTGDTLNWQLCAGFLGHDNIPHRSSVERSCWVPAVESSRDDATDAPPPKSARTSQRLA
jgi:hypothetical protein